MPCPGGWHVAVNQRESQSASGRVQFSGLERETLKNEEIKREMMLYIRKIQISLVQNKSRTIYVIAVKQY